MKVNFIIFIYDGKIYKNLKKFCCFKHELYDDHNILNDIGLLILKKKSCSQLQNPISMLAPIFGGLPRNRSRRLRCRLGRQIEFENTCIQIKQCQINHL